jgi:hypothetical protein
VESRVPARLIDINYSHEDSVETKRATASTATSGCTHTVQCTLTLQIARCLTSSIVKQPYKKTIFHIKFSVYLCLSVSLFDMLSILPRIRNTYGSFFPSCSPILSLYPLMYPLFNILPDRRKTRKSADHSKDEL